MRIRTRFWLLPLAILLAVVPLAGLHPSTTSTGQILRADGTGPIPPPPTPIPPAPTVSWHSPTARNKEGDEGEIAW